MMAAAQQKQTGMSVAAPGIPQRTVSQRFVDRLEKELGVAAEGGQRLTPFQMQLAQGYYVMVDKMLSTQEQGRNKSQNPLEYSWQNVNLAQFALDAVNCMRLGLDMQEPNQLFAIPYKNGKTGKYDLRLAVGYAGKVLLARKYAVVPIRDITVQVVHQNDLFVPLMKGVDNPYDNYRFEVEKPFDRGDIVGAFAYVSYADPERNKLLFMSLRDIHKRAMVNKANKEFWGETRDGAFDQSKHDVGWLEEMCAKTMLRKAAGTIVLDKEKVFAQNTTSSAVEPSTYASVVEIDGDGYYLEEGPAQVDAPAPAVEAEGAQAAAQAAPLTLSEV